LLQVTAALEEEEEEEEEVSTLQALGLAIHPS